MRLGLTAQSAHELRASVRATVQKRDDASILGTIDDNLSFTDVAEVVVARLPELRFEPKVVPSLPTKYGLAFLRIHILVGEHPVRHTSEVARRASGWVDGSWRTPRAW